MFEASYTMCKADLAETDVVNRASGAVFTAQPALRV
jgi:hypothetical protein